MTGSFSANDKPDCVADPNHHGCGGDKDDTTTDTVDPKSEFPAPVPIGVSTGNEKTCSAGTIGARVSGGGKVFALSNNHVYAASNGATIGTPGTDDTSSDTIHQPGRYDTNCVTSGQVIGVLYAFVPIDFDGDNEVDAAIALNDPTNLGHTTLGNATPSDGYGTPKSATGEAELEMLVLKYGRTTGQTPGEIVIVGWTGNIGYSSGIARFVGQIVVYRAKGGPFLKSGDSGSLLVTADDYTPVGLIFAGNASGKYGIANQIGPVLSAFGVTIDGD